MRHGSIVSVVLLSGGLVLAIGACGDDEDDSNGGSASGSASDVATTTTEPDAAPDDTGVAGGVDPDADLVIEGFAFGDVAPVAAGATVTVANVDGAPHTVTSDDDAWESVRVEGGGSGEVTAPDDAGEYAFHCDIHPTMTGTLVVE